MPVAPHLPAGRDASFATELATRSSRFDALVSRTLGAVATWRTREGFGLRGRKGEKQRGEDEHVGLEPCASREVPALRLPSSYDAVMTLGLLLALLQGPPPSTPPAQDWLLPSLDRTPAEVRLEHDGRTLVIENGLARRVWRLEGEGAAACISLERTALGRAPGDASGATELLRAVRPEAELVLNGETIPVGGLTGQPDHAFLLPEWLDVMRPPENALRFTGWSTREPSARLAWGRIRPAAPDVAWPPHGVALQLDFVGSGVGVEVHYELYDGIPLFQKWVVVRNTGSEPLEVDRLTTEILAVVEFGNHVEVRDHALPIPDSIHVETDYAMGGFNPLEAMRYSVHWQPDPEFHTQVNYLKREPCLLRVEPTRGPDQILQPGEELTSIRAFELLHDGGDRERRGLAQRRIYRTVAPWVTENPLILHVVSTDDAVVRAAVDQATEVGFEMVLLSFGSGLDMENEGAENHAKFRTLREYAEARGIQLGGYSLLASRSIGGGQDVVSPAGTSPIFGNSPALASEWGRAYFGKIRSFFDATGFLAFEHDGSYPGDYDDTARPPLQRGLEDSQWVQWRMITALYSEMRARGVYLRVPDYYYFNGANECGMGYRETNWSLPRELQVIHARQNVFDGTWEKTPTMGWMFVPLTQYHGGGEAATIEPLDTHLDHYERMLASHLGAGVQACYRGTRLFDTPRVRDAVKAWVDWYKAHRAILESDVIHGRRADGRDVDWLLHVNPRLEERAMLCAWNPLDQEVVQNLRVPLHYAGLSGSAFVASGSGSQDSGLDWRESELEADAVATIAVRIPARGFAWAIFRSALPAPHPQRRHGHRAEFLADGRLLSFGGFDHGSDDGERGTTATWMWDPRASAWEQKSDLLLPKTFHASVSVDGEVFALGDDVERWDDAAQKWVQIHPPGSVPKTHFAAAAVGRKIYAFGGFPKELAPVMLDLDTGTRERFPPPPGFTQGDHFHFVWARDGWLHVAGGMVETGISDRHWAWDGHAWTARAPLPAPAERKFAVWGVASGELQVFAYEGCWRYDGERDAWRTIAAPPWPRDRAMAASVSRRGRLLGIGGFSYGGVFRGVDEYDPASGSWTTRD